MTTTELIEKMIAYQAIEPCMYDLTDLIARVATGRILSGGQQRWIDTVKAWKKPPSAAEMGRKGGQSTSKAKKEATKANLVAARAAVSLTAQERTDRAKAAAKARWKKKDQEQ